MNIFEAIREDHDIQRELLDKLMDTSGSSETRKQYFAELKAALTHHEVAEERYFYAPLMEFDNTMEPCRHAVAEHHEIDELIEKVEEADMSSAAWMAHMKNLQHKVLHHLKEEEREFFQQAGKVLTGDQKQELADAYQQEMQAQSK
ncbi:MAG: hemerythrin domain-containing protein [Paraglaciecola sp.]|uniref:hemerythrin domain-containing protein n=1 Tax=Pseudomonadati TaxID=3379134 RepID=UPI00273FFBD1|nr:hemerythrin domain-containing protein [Paraglaciecola sp.]MDP5033244.1 hemerythrin domain-containing protein [Paraglaciecola sp.]MDP5129598.1 hemerythrin domain-containing protein [Paraglaciecola sp.]